MKLTRLVIEAFGPLAPGTCFEPGSATGSAGPLLVPVDDPRKAQGLVLALRFALYGDAGEWAEAAGLSAALSLDFEIGSAAYRVKRCPPKTGITTRKGNEALLWCRTGLQAPSKDGEVLKRGRQDVDAHLAELMGIDADSFCKALVLPVGRLSRTLGESEALNQCVAEAVDVGPALQLEQELERALGVIEAEADALLLERREALAGATAVIEPDRRVPLDIEDFEAHAALLTARHLELQAGLADLREGEEKARQLLTTAKERQERIDALEAAKVELQAVEMKSPEIEQRKRELERAEQAAKFAPREAELSDKPLLRELDRVTAAHAKDSQAHEAATEAATVAGEALQGMELRAPELAELKAELAGLEEFKTISRVLRDATADKQAAALEVRRHQGLLTEKQRAHDAAGSKLDELRAERDAALARVGGSDVARVEALRLAVDASKVVVKQARRLEELVELRKAATKDHATGKIRLDRLRSEGESAERDLEHAERRGGDLAESERARRRRAEINDEILRISIDADEQLDRVTSLGREVLQLRRLLGTKAYTDASLLVAEANSAERALEEAGSPAETLARCETELREQSDVEARLALEVERVGQDAESAAADEESSSALVAELSERLPEALRGEGALEATARRLTKEIAELEAQRERATTVSRQSRTQLGECDRALSLSRERLEDVQARVAEAMGAMQTELTAVGFASVSDYKSAGRAKGERARLKSLIATHEESLRTAGEVYRRVRGETDVPVLRERDRGRWASEEWERRQAERAERLQAERVRRDLDLLQSLQSQLAFCVDEAEREEVEAAVEVRELAKTAAGVNDLTVRLLALRDHHSAAATLADIAGGRRGKGESFAACFEAAATEEIVLRASSWTRWLSCGALDLHRVSLEQEGLDLELREIDGRRVQALSDLHGERRFLVSLALGLGLRDAALACRGERAPETIFLDGGLEKLPPEQSAAAQGMLERLAAVGRSVTVLHEDADVPLIFEGRVAPLLMVKPDVARKEAS